MALSLPLAGSLWRGPSNDPFAFWPGKERDRESQDGELPRVHSHGERCSVIDLLSCTDSRVTVCSSGEEEKRGATRSELDCSQAHTALFSLLFGKRAGNRVP